ncbi:MAG: hypothetical protein CMO26_16705 [Thiotrichales bacterium]|nr:hypothetical protein [Thiotrichales bacterium]
MTVRELIEIYLDGWRLGTAARSLQACAPGFYYDDPNTGRIARSEFPDFVEDFKAYGASLNGGVVPSPFLEYTHTVIDAAQSPATIWCWWRVNNTRFQGTALVQANATGVLWERIAYYAPLPQ